MPSSSSSSTPSAPLRVLAVSGGLHAPSTTRLLAEGILDRLARRRAAETEVLELSPFARDLAQAVVGEGRTPQVDHAIERLRGADLVVVATPVYRGSYTGLLKEFVDLLPQDALAGTPVLLAASGGSDEHSLVLDHELRPLFAFFGALTLPSGVYARPGDFADGALTEQALEKRVDPAITAALPFLPA